LKQRGLSKTIALLESMFRGAVLLVFVSVNTARAADEEGLISVWRQHLIAPDDHAVAIKACEAFVAAHPADPLVPVARGIEAWHKLRDGRRSEASAIWEADLSLPSSALNDCARRLAFGWMSRFDREKVVEALQAYYKKEVAYPKELSQISIHPGLKNGPKPPETDRFGKPWSYTLTGFEKTKGFKDQKYSLRSAVLGDLSELNAAEKLAYGSKIIAVPQRVVTLPNNTLGISFNVGSGVLLSMVGPGAGDLHLAFVGNKFIVVCDHTHWKILPRP
jgi:hypothetical protein